MSPAIQPVGPVREAAGFEFLQQVKRDAAPLCDLFQRHAPRQPCAPQIAQRQPTDSLCLLMPRVAHSCIYCDMLANLISPERAGNDRLALTGTVLLM